MILDDVFDYLMGGPLPAIRVRAAGWPSYNPVYRVYVSSHFVGYCLEGYYKALWMAEHSRKHWCDIPHTCPPVTYVRVDGELGDDSDDPPSMTAWQQDLEEDRMHEEVRP